MSMINLKVSTHGVLSFLSRHPPLNNINIRRHGWHTRTIQCWSFPWASLTIFPGEFILSHSLELDISFEARWFFPVSPTNKADHHDIAEILLKVALNALKQTKMSSICLRFVNLCFIHFQVLLFLMVSYHVSLRSEFRFVMSVTIICPRRCKCKFHPMCFGIPFWEKCFTVVKMIQ
jgi:hypothetical protein